MSSADVEEARAFLARVELDTELQRWIKDQIGRLVAHHHRAREARLGIALIELLPGRAHRLAHCNGDIPY